MKDLNEEPYRVLMAKLGLDGHERGARTVARTLKKYGMDVTYTGIRCTPEMVADAVIKFNIELVGLSILSGAQLELVPRVIEELQRRALGETIVVVGGIIPEADKRLLLEMGVAGVFGPGSDTTRIADFINRTLQEHRYRIANRP